MLEYFSGWCIFFVGRWFPNGVFFPCFFFGVHFFWAIGGDEVTLKKT